MRFIEGWDALKFDIDFANNPSATRDALFDALPFNDEGAPASFPIETSELSFQKGSSNSSCDIVRDDQTPARQSVPEPHHTAPEPRNVRRSKKPQPRQRPRTHICACGQAFQYPKDLRRHQPTHTGERTYKCPVQECAYASAGFPRLDSLARHMTNVHSSSETRGLM